MLDYLYLFCFKIFVIFVKFTPRFITDSILNFFAFIAYKTDARHKKIARVNLDLAYEDKMSDKEKKRITKKCYKNLLYNMRDFVENQGITKEKLLKKATIHNEHFYTDIKKEGKGVIFLTAHYGNWELLPLCMGATYGKLWGVGRNLDSEKMNEVLQKIETNLMCICLKKVEQSEAY